MSISSNRLTPPILVLCTSNCIYLGSILVAGLPFRRIIMSHVLFLRTVDKQISGITSCQATATMLSEQMKTGSSPRFNFRFSGFSCSGMFLRWKPSRTHQFPFFATGSKNYLCRWCGQHYQNRPVTAAPPVKGRKVPPGKCVFPSVCYHVQTISGFCFG